MGNATELPYEDASFDVVHCHALLTHAPDTQAVLAEAKRVLKPGGLMSARELLGSAGFLEPDIGIAAAWETFLKLLAANQGHPQMGKELKGAFVDAGFTNIRATASFETYGTADDIAFFVELVNGWFFDPKTMGAAIQFGVATQEQFDEWRALDRPVEQAPRRVLRPPLGRGDRAQAIARTSPMHGARSWREPAGRRLPVAASYLHAGDHVRELGSTGRAMRAAPLVQIDAARDIQATSDALPRRDRPPAPIRPLAPSCRRRAARA